MMNNYDLQLDDNIILEESNNLDISLGVNVNYVNATEFLEYSLERCGISETDEAVSLTERIGMRVLENSRKPQRYLFENLIVEGEQIILAGAPKTGKTLMAMQMGIAAAKGSDFLGYKCMKRNKVLYINLEVSDEQFCKRLVTMSGGEDAYVQNVMNGFIPFSDIRTFDVLSNDEDIDQIKDQIKLHKPDLIIFDVLSRCHYAQENDNGEMKIVISRLRRLSDGITSIIVHHTKKPIQGMENVNYGPSSIRGASSIFGEVDSALILLARQGDGAKLSLSITSRNVSGEDEILMNRDENLCLYRADDDEDTSFIKHLAAIFNGEAMIEPKVLREGLGEAYSKNRNKISGLIRKAVELDLIMFNKSAKGHAVYEVTKDSKILSPWL